MSAAPEEPDPYSTERKNRDQLRRSGIGLATRLLSHNLVLRENREVVQEPRPTMSSSLPMSRGCWGINYRL
jgi:hypothetical protein